MCLRSKINIQCLARLSLKFFYSKSLSGLTLMLNVRLKTCCGGCFLMWSDCDMRFRSRAAVWTCSSQPDLLETVLGSVAASERITETQPCWRWSHSFVVTLQASSLVCRSHLKGCCSLLSVSLLFLSVLSLLSLFPTLTFCSPSLSSSIPAADMVEYRSKNHGAMWTVPTDNGFPSAQWSRRGNWQKHMYWSVVSKFFTSLYFNNSCLLKPRQALTGGAASFSGCLRPVFTGKDTFLFYCKNTLSLTPLEFQCIDFMLIWVFLLCSFVLVSMMCRSAKF